jgi:hypothetical protein
VRFLPGLALEPPTGYVAFVATHLAALRRAAAAALGDEDDGDQLARDVLTDVASRWWWLDLARRWLHQPDAAARYLYRALGRRSQRWRPEALVTGPDDEPAPVEIVVWATGQPPWQPRPSYSSGATRLAPFLTPGPRGEFSAVAEAAVAWWHAYEAKRRRRFMALLVVLFLLFVLLVQAGEVLSS